MASNARVALVTVSYHSEPQVRELIQSLGVLGAGECELIVVSNSGDCESLQNNSITVIQAGRNLGFSRANNLGSAATSAKYLLFCNPDVRITTKAVLILAQLLDSHPDCGIVAPYLSSDVFMLEPTGKINRMGQEAGIWNIGACFLIRRDLYDSIGGWDEHFFLWWEDTDLRDRVLASGSTVAFADGVVMGHVGGHSYAEIESTTKKFLTRVWICSRIYYLRKHKGLSAALVWCAGMIFSNCFRALSGSAAGRPWTLPNEAVKFGLLVLLNSYRLQRYTVFDGNRFCWQ